MHITLQHHSTADTLRGQTDNASLARNGLAGVALAPSAWIKRSGAASLALLASFAWIPSPAKAQAQQFWQPYGTVVHSLQQNKGGKVSSLDTSSELMTSNMTLTVYKSPPTTDQYDYYLIAGPFSHAVTSLTNNANGAGWAIFNGSTNNATERGYGWCGATMNLDISASDELGGPAILNTYSPETTTTLQSKTVSGTLSTGGVSLDYSVSVDAPDVSMAVTRNGPSVGYSATLPCPQESAPYQYLVPDPTSEYGTTLQVAVIYQVEHGKGLRINWDSDVWWRFYLEHTPTTGEFNTTQFSTTNNNLAAAGSALADFGASPTYKSNGSVNLGANGPQIVDQYGYCLSGQNAASNSTPNQPGVVSGQACDGSKPGQKWYYTANSQIVNVQTGTCLDIAGGFPQGGTPNSGAGLILSACMPALPTGACVTSGHCATTSTVASQQWQLTSSTATSFNLTSSSGYVVNADPITSRFTLQTPSSATDFNLK